MLRAPIYSLTERPEATKVGYIIWDGERLGVHPRDNSTLEAIAQEPLWLGGEDIITPESDPEKWLRSLYRGLHGSYLWAGQAEEFD